MAEETRVPGEKRRPTASNLRTSQHANMYAVIGGMFYLAPCFNHEATEAPMERRRPASDRTATRTSDLPLEIPVTYLNEGGRHCEGDMFKNSWTFTRNITVSVTHQGQT